MPEIYSYKLSQLKALHDHVLVKSMNFSERLTSGGIVLPGDDSRSQGIRPRWAEVFAVGPTQTEITPGQYVLISHGRWTRGVTIDHLNEEITIRRIDINDILLVSDEYHSDDTISTAEAVSTDPHGIFGSMHNS